MLHLKRLKKPCSKDWMTSPKITVKEYSKLRDLGDLLVEVQGAKEEGYLTGLTYLDTAWGINPIVEKLPYGIQDKWFTVGSKFKEENNGLFPPFDHFASFICNEPRRRNQVSYFLAATKHHVKCLWGVLGTKYLSTKLMFLQGRNHQQISL